MFDMKRSRTFGYTIDAHVTDNILPTIENGNIVILALLDYAKTLDTTIVVPNRKQNIKIFYSYI